MGSFGMKRQRELIKGPYQTPIAIQMTTTVVATSDLIRLLRFAILNKKKLSGRWAQKIVHTKNN
jgi:predicted metalloprotease